MRLLIDALPRESILHLWVRALSITELPVGYQIPCGLSVLGCLLRRNVWVDQVEWKVYPNLSVLLVGPSGVGKDVAIRAASRLVSHVDEELHVGGKTIETIQSELVKRNPAIAFVGTPELTAFLGGRDYQKSIVQEMTDLLTTGDSINVSLKSEGKRIIHSPTITMQAGSTQEWLHKAMPEGSLEGGFLPRFLIICEEYGERHVPLIKHSTGLTERLEALHAKQEFYEKAQAVAASYAVWPREMILTEEAAHYYTNWYINRFNYFSPAVRSYANRSRDQVLRIAMICACSCNRDWMEERDVAFAATMMQYVADTVEEVTQSSSVEGKIVQTVLSLLPATQGEIMKALIMKHSRRQVIEVLSSLVEAQMVIVKGGKFMKASGKE